MHQSYIVRQPIHDKNLNAWAYEILYTNPDEPSEAGQGENEAATAIETFLSNYSAEVSNDDAKKCIFMTYTPNLIERNVPGIFKPETMVVQIDDEIILNEKALSMVGKLRAQGYKVAHVGFDFNARSISTIDKVDYIKINLSKLTHSHLSIIEVAHALGKEVMAYNVNDEQTLKVAQKLGVDHFQGTYIANAQLSEVRQANHLPANFLQLMVAITRSEPEFAEIESIISRDVSLTYALLKLVNSAYFALRQRVGSVRQALTLLGLEQLKQWIYLLSFQSSNDIPEEFIKLSFMRATFCSKLQPFVSSIGISADECYLMGMLSTLGGLLNKPLSEVLEGLDITPEIKSALTDGEGSSGKVFKLVTCYECADWLHLNQYAQELALPLNIISKLYFECMETVNKIWHDLMHEAS